MKRFLLLSVFSLFLLVSANAQWNTDFYADNRVYQSGIHSVDLHPSDTRLGEPVAVLGEYNQLVLEFDDVETDDHYLK